MSPRDDYDDFFGEEDDAPVVDTRAAGRLYRLPLARLSPNLVNPRTDFGTQDELLDFGKSLKRRQNQPCPAVSRSAYLKLWPDHADRIGDIDYVIVSGERRYRAASAVGMETLDCVVNDDFAASRKVFMEAVVSENIDRRNFDPIEEANAVAAMAAEFESNRKVAEHFERADSWVTMRIDLTYLCHEMQDLVRSKSIPLEDARILGKLVKNSEVPTDHESQLAWWEGRAAEKAAKAAARKAEKAAKRQEPAAPVAPAGSSFTAVKLQAPAEEPPVVHPEPQPAAPETGTTAPVLPDPREAVVPAAPSAPLGEQAAEPEVQAAPELVPSAPSSRPEPPTPSSVLGPGLMALPEFQRSQLLHEYVKHAGSVEAMVADLSRGLPQDKVLHLGQILRDVANGMLERVDVPV
jgi:ParB family chromosome partitioning protein